MNITTEFIERVEEEYLSILVDLLERGDLTTPQAKKITRAFLELTPFTSSDDMEQKIQKFTTDHPEFGGLYINLLKLEGEAKETTLINQMRSHIKENKLDEALKLVDNNT